jgi:hypothetical protein
MTAPALSVAEFADKVLKRPLWSHQREFVEDEAFVRVIAGGRRSGKTSICELEVMHCAFSNPGSRCVVLSAGRDSARRVVESIAEDLNRNKLTRGSLVDDFSQRIILTNKSEIISVPASQKAIRGMGAGVLRLVVDEAGHLDDTLWDAARFIIYDERAQGSRIIVAGTPRGKGFFRECYQRGLGGDPDYSAFHWSAEQNELPGVRELITKDRARMNSVTAEREIDGLWTAAAGSIFSEELLDSVTADFTVPAYEDLRLPARGILGCDWGISHDRSAVAAVFRLPVASLNPEGRLPRFVALPYQFQAGAPLHAVVKGLIHSIPCFSHVSSEVSGVGAAFSGELRRLAVQSRQRGDGKTMWNFVNTTSALKQSGYGLILAMFERGQLIIPRDPELIRQLEGLRFEEHDKYTSIEADTDTKYDDLCDALLMATIPHKPARAHRVVCHLAHIAGSKTAPPDAPVPALACGTVETGGGLRVPEMPTLQSVGSEAWTAYAPVAAARPEGKQIGKYLITT